jgi:hypothetical protein
MMGLGPGMVPMGGPPMGPGPMMQGKTKHNNKVQGSGFKLKGQGFGFKFCIFIALVLFVGIF